MPSYTIITQFGTVLITEQSGFVATSSVPFLEGMDWRTVRSHAQQSGWRIVPTLDDGHPHRIVVRGVTYDFFWSGDRIADIVKNEDEHITWEQVPQEVKGML